MSSSSIDIGVPAELPAGSRPAAAPSSGAPASGAAPPVDPGKPEDAERKKAEAARKEIVFFDRSLKRTEILERGLDSAARCVQKLLPKKPPLIPGYTFGFTYQQSEKVGGDFFDFIPLSGGLLGISVGDMSGRGMEAAVLMCLAKKVISIRARDRRENVTSMPREVLVQANDDLRMDLDRTAFITALYAVLDPQAGTLRFARAGHERPILFSPVTGMEPRFLASEGVALGVMAGDQFSSRLQEFLVEMPPGSRLLLYTDGLIDRPDLPAVAGLDRLRAALEDASADDLERLCDEVLATMRAATSDDDVAIACLRLADAPLHLEIDADPSQLSEVRRALRTWLSGRTDDDGLIADLVLATSEAAANAIEHAYRDGGDGRVEVHGTTRDDSVEIVVRDHGVWSPPREAANDRGRGFAVIEASTDGFDVEQRDDGTEVRLRRSLADAAPLGR